MTEQEHINEIGLMRANKIAGLCGITEEGINIADAMEISYRRLLELKSSAESIMLDIEDGDGENAGFVDCEIRAFAVRNMRRALAEMRVKK